MLRKPLGIALYLNSIPPYFRRLLSLSQAGKTISMESGIKRNQENRQRNFCVGKCRRVKKRFRQCQFQTQDDLFQIRRMQNLETDKRAFETLSFRKNIWLLAPKALITLLILFFLLTIQHILHSLHSLPETYLFFYISHLGELKHMATSGGIYRLRHRFPFHQKKFSFENEGSRDRQTDKKRKWHLADTDGADTKVHSFRTGENRKITRNSSTFPEKKGKGGQWLNGCEAVPPKKTGTEEISYSVTGINDPRNLSQRATPTPIPA